VSFVNVNSAAPGGDEYTRQQAHRNVSSSPHTDETVTTANFSVRT